MAEQIFFSPQVKRSVIVSNKLVYASCIANIRKYQQNLKTSWNYCLALSRPSEMKILSELVKISDF